MAQYHIYQLESKGEKRIIETTGVQNAGEVDSLIAKTHGLPVGSVNWRVCSSKTLDAPNPNPDYRD